MADAPRQKRSTLHTHIPASRATLDAFGLAAAQQNRMADRRELEVGLRLNRGCADGWMPVGGLGSGNMDCLRGPRRQGRRVEDISFTLSGASRRAGGRAASTRAPGRSASGRPCAALYWRALARAGPAQTGHAGRKPRTCKSASTT